VLAEESSITCTTAPPRFANVRVVPCTPPDGPNEPCRCDHAGRLVRTLAQLGLRSAERRIDGQHERASSAVFFDWSTPDDVQMKSVLVSQITSGGRRGPHACIHGRIKSTLLGFAIVAPQFDCACRRFDGVKPHDSSCDLRDRPFCATTRRRGPYELDCDRQSSPRGSVTLAQLGGCRRPEGRRASMQAGGHCTLRALDSACYTSSRITLVRTSTRGALREMTGVERPTR